MHRARCVRVRVVQRERCEVRDEWQDRGWGWCSRHSPVKSSSLVLDVIKMERMRILG